MTSSPTHHLFSPLARIVVALALALMGQNRLEQAEPQLLVGLPLVVVAAVLLWRPQRLTMLRHDEPAPDHSEMSAPQPVAARRDFSVPVLFALSTASLVATLHLHNQMQASQMPASAARPVAAWLIAVAAFLIACRRLDRTRDDLKPFAIGWTRRDTIFVCGAMALALALRVVNLDRAPLTFSGDEGQMAMEAVRVGQGQITDPFTTGWLSHPTLWFFLQSFSIRIFGDSVLGVRMISALLGSATIGSTYFFAHLLYGRRIAVLTAVLLAAYHFHIHFSRMALNNVADPLFGTLILSCLVLGYRTRRRLMFGLSGLLLGLSLYFYPGARLFLSLVFCLCLLRLVADLRHNSQPRRVKFWLLAALIGMGITVAAGPLLQTFVQHPDQFMARMTSEGVSRRWFEEEAGKRGLTLAQVGWRQITHAALAFNSYPEAGLFYVRVQPRPLLWGGASALMLLGLLLAFFRLRQWAYQIPIAWFVLAVFFGGVMLRLPPGSARYITLAPVACLFIAIAIAQLMKDIEAALTGSTQVRSRSLAVKILAAGVVIFLSVDGVKDYFVNYVPHDRIGGVNTHAANALAVYLKEQPRGTRVFFLGAPRMFYHGFGNLEFIARHVAGADVAEPLQESSAVPPLDPTHPTIYAALPERIEELAIIQSRYPGGASQSLTWPTENGPLVHVYKVEPAVQ